MLPPLSLSRLSLCLASLIIPPLLTAERSHAATLHWDGDSTGPDADGGSGSWNQGSFDANWDTSATGGSDAYWNGGEDAVFGGTGGTVTFNGSTPVAVSSITFTAPGYTIHSLPRKLGVLSGMRIDTGVHDATIIANIVNSSNLRKIGTGTLTFYAGDELYSGIITIEQGTVKPGGYAPFGSSNADTHVWSGARIDTSGKSLGGERIRIQGHGPDGKGALVNNGAHGSDTLHELVLDASSTIGGDFNWEMGTNSDFQTTSVQMGLHTLTKSGPNNINLWSTSFTSPGNIDLKEGSLSFWKSTFLGGSAGNVLTIRSGAEFRQLTNDREQLWTLAIEDGGSWEGAAYGASSWKGPINLLGGTAIFDSLGSSTIGLPSMRVLGVISGPGALMKTGEGIYTLSAVNTYSGGTIVNGGTLILNASGAVRGAMTVNASGTLQLPLTDSLGTDPATRVGEVNLSGGTLDVTATATPSIPLLKIGSGTLRSNGGVPDPLAASYYVLGNNAAIQVTGSGGGVISGRLHLGSGNAGNRSLIEVPASAVGEGLRIDAAITGTHADAGITKTGGGRMILNGPVHYSGETRVAAGSVLLGPLGDMKQSPVRVGSGGGFGTAIPGKTISSIIAEDGATLILPAVTSGATVVTGTLNLSGGSVAIAPVLGGDLVVGETYDLLIADSITGSGVPVLDMSGAFGPSGATGTLAVNGNKIQFTLTCTGANLVWSNASAGAVADGIWDTSLANFSDGVSAVPFRAFDSVTFDDSVAAGSAKTITLGASLAPLRVTVANSNGDYSFAPPGALASLGSLVKTGSSKLTVGGSDNLTLGGSITAGGGILDLSGRTVQATSLTISGGGQFNNATASVGTLDLRSGRSDASLTSPGPWTKTTSSNVILTGMNNLPGPCSIVAGQLTIGSTQVPTATFGSGPVSIATGARFSFYRSEATTAIPNTFSGGGELSLNGANNGSNGFSIFNLPGDTSGFTGPISVSNARISAETFNKLDRGGRVTITGRGVVEVKDRTVPNAFMLNSGGGGWGSSSANLGNLYLDNATLSGPITLGISSNNLVTSPPSGPRHSIISGSISSTSTLGEGGMSFNSNNNPNNIFTLSGASTYKGATTIAANTRLNLTGSLGATTVTVNSMGSIGGGGSIGSGGALNFLNQGVLRVIAGATPLRVGGNVNLGTATRVAFESAVEGVLNGPVPILEYTGTLTGGVAQLSTLYSSSYHRKAVFAVVPGAITLDIGARELTWTGADGAVWGQSSLNWTSSAGPDSFYRGDSVIFPDRGPGVWRVNHDGDTLVPSAVKVNNETTEYQIVTPISGAGSVVKNGAGKLVLSFTSTYSGGTTVNGGVLEATSSSLGTGPLLVAAAGTIAGNAVIPGAVTIHGTVNPGTPNQTTTATLQMGHTTLKGNYLCQLSASSSDRLTVVGNLNLDGATLTLQPSYGASSSAASYIIASYTGTLSGSFATVNGLPAGYVVKHLPAQKQLVVARISFADWAASYPGLADLTAEGDPDADGLPNLIEYVLAGNPALADSLTVPTQTLTADTLVFHYKRNDVSKFNTTQTVQWATDLGTWNSIPVSLDSSPGVEVVSNGAAPDDITVSIPRTSRKMFARLKVTEP